MITRHAWIRAAAFCAALAAASAALPTPTLRADAVDDNIAAMKKFEHDGDDGKCIGKMQELRDSGGEKGIKAIRSMIESKNDKIACAAVKNLANMKAKDVEFLKWLCGKIEDKELYKEKDGRPDLYKAILDGIVAFKYEKAAQPTFKSALPKIVDMVKKFISTDGEYGSRLIRAYGCVREPAVMEQLLDWGEGIEARTGKGGGGGGGSHKGASQETRDAEGKSKKAILEVISDITGKEGVDIATWRKWWTESGKTFQFPEASADAGAAGPAAPQANIDPAAAEFKDETYGFSAKKPEGEEWKWMKADYTADETPRVMLKFEPKSGEVARAYFIIHQTKKGPPKDVKGFVKWCLEDPKGPFKTQLETDEKHAPKEEPCKQAGWTMVRGAGNGIGARSGFGSQERRWYFVEMGTNILYVDAVIRLGADQAVTDAFWKCLDTISLPAAKK